MAISPTIPIQRLVLKQIPMLADSVRVILCSWVPVADVEHNLTRDVTLSQNAHPQWADIAALHKTAIRSGRRQVAVWMELIVMKYLETLDRTMSREFLRGSRHTAAITVPSSLAGSPYTQRTTCTCMCRSCYTSCLMKKLLQSSKHINVWMISTRITWQHSWSVWIPWSLNYNWPLLCSVSRVHLIRRYVIPFDDDDYLEN
jgi:hypothetical protein